MNPSTEQAGTARDRRPWRPRALWRRRAVASGLPGGQVVHQIGRDASILLFVGAVFMILRLPLQVVLAGLLPIAVLLWNGIRVPRVASLPMWGFLVVGLVCSMWAWVRIPDIIAGRVQDEEVTPIGMVNNATLVMVMIAMSAAVTLTTHTDRVFRRLVAGIVTGLWVCLGIAVFEVVSGIKVLPLIYPDANTADQISTNRFVVASFFPNFNDFSVAMALFGMVLFAQLLLGANVAPLRKLARIAALVLVAFFIVVIGSRGALAALMIGLVLVWVTAARLGNRRLVSVPAMLLGVVGGVLAVVSLLTMPFVRDNSALRRTEIISNSLAMMPWDDGYFWHGFLSMTYFRQLATDAYGPLLMDPHNMLLEIATMYGVPTLLAYLVAWLSLVHRGLWQLRIAPGWREVSVVVMSALLPVVGIVPSSSLRYYWVYLLLAATVAAFQLDDERRLAGRSALVPVDDARPAAVTTDAAASTGAPAGGPAPRR